MTLLFTVDTASPEETAAAGRRLAGMLRERNLPRFVAVEGDLGAGKTEFCRGVVSELSPGSAVRSPTYTIVNEYRKGPLPVFHFDFYRLSGSDDLSSTGFYDYPEEGFFLVEWASAIPEELPERRIEVRISSPDGPLSSRRTVTALLTGDISGESD